MRISDWSSDVCSSDLDAYHHVVITAGDYDEREIAAMGARIREHRASVVLALDTLEIEAQMSCAAAFLNALFDAPREHWFPALVVVDEAQMRSEEHTSELQSLMRISYAVFCLTKKNNTITHVHTI